MSKKEFDESKNLLAAILEENVPDCKENEQMENKIGKFSSSITDDEITLTSDLNQEFVVDCCNMVKPFCSLIKSTYASFKGVFDVMKSKMKKYAEDDIDTIIKKSFPDKDNIVFTICKKKEWVEMNSTTKKLVDVYSTSLVLTDEEALKRAVDYYGSEPKFAIVKRTNGNNAKTKNPFKAIEWINEVNAINASKE